MFKLIYLFTFIFLYSNMFKRINTLAFLFLFLMVPATCFPADPPEWRIAEQTIRKCYDSNNIEVSVSTGYEHRIYQNGPVDGEFATAMITVPIYSRKQQIDRQNQIHEKMEHLSGLYAEHQSQSAIIYALSKEKDVLQRTMIDEGAKGISAYYELIKEVEKATSLRDSAQRKIISWLELCGHVAKD
jgi:hypothetical protein